MKFVFPCAEYERQALDYLREFHEYGSHVHGSGGLDSALKEGTYQDWLAKVLSDIDIANVKDGRVPALTYFYVSEEDNSIVGMINIRLALNDFLRIEGGHIGYSVRPTQRRRGHATEMLRRTLIMCRNIGMHDFIITCDKSNPASAAVIVKNGGALDAEFYSESFRTMEQRYIIP